MTPSPVELRDGLQQEALSYLTRAAMQLGDLPRWGVLLAGAEGAVTVAALPDWRSISPSIQRAAETAYAVVVVFPYYTREIPRQPRVGVIACARGCEPLTLAMTLSISPLQPGTEVVGRLPDYLIPPALPLW